MTEAKHTPAPWRAVTWDGNLSEIPIETIDGNTPVAFVVGENRVDHSRLISAAPELLKALIGIKPLVEDDSFTRPFLDAANAAIAKAKGKQP